MTNEVLKNIDIIIPTSTNPKGLEALLKSIYTYTDSFYINRIIVVVNGDVDQYKNVSNKPFPEVLFINYNEQLGYAKAVNSGINTLCEDGTLVRDIVLLNDDCVLLEQEKNSWLELLREPTNQPNIGITAPLVNYIPASLNKYALFFCAYITAECFNEVGLLDESLWSYYEDMDFCFRAEKKGYKTLQVCADDLKSNSGIVVGGFPIYHEGGVTHKGIEGIDNIIRENFYKVLRKHGYGEEVFGFEKTVEMAIPERVVSERPQAIEKLMNHEKEIFISLDSLASKLKVSYSEIKYKLYTEQARRIDGYMSPKELVALSIIASNPGCKVFVEVGSWMGRSSNAIAKALSIKGGVLICVDTWLGTENEGSAHDQAKGMDGDYAFSKFIQNNQDYILKGTIVPLRMKSQNVFNLLCSMGVKADVVFLDADHSYEAVKKDIENSRKILNENGIICGHDYSNDWLGVVGAVNESFGMEHNVVHETGIWIKQLNYNGGKTDEPEPDNDGQAEPEPKHKDGEFVVFAKEMANTFNSLKANHGYVFDENISLHIVEYSSVVTLNHNTGNIFIGRNNNKLPTDFIVYLMIWCYFKFYNKNLNYLAIDEIAVKKYCISGLSKKALVEGFCADIDSNKGLGTSISVARVKRLENSFQNIKKILKDLEDESNRD
jgi:hypothetical protein